MVGPVGSEEDFIVSESQWRSSNAGDMIKVTLPTLILDSVSQLLCDVLLKQKITFSAKRFPSRSTIERHRKSFLPSDIRQSPLCNTIKVNFYLSDKLKHCYIFLIHFFHYKNWTL